MSAAATHEHRFDALSGYCDRCGYRDDGRLISWDGREFRPGPEYTPQQLQDIRERARR